MKKIMIISILSMIFGVTSGIAIGRKQEVNKQVFAGVLRLDNSEKDQDTRLFLELEVPLDTLIKSHSAQFKVLKKNYISHK